MLTLMKYVKKELKRVRMILKKKERLDLQPIMPILNVNELKRANIQSRMKIT